MISISSPYIDEEEYNSVINVLRTKQLAQGPLTLKFEKEYSSLFDFKYSAATNSGTSGLHLSLLSSGVKKGDKVLTTPFSFIATTNSILYCGAVPIFADIDPLTFNISAESINEMLGCYPDIKYLLIVHMFGQPCDMSSIMKIVKKYNLTLIEDCAQAHGATYNGQQVGSFGKAGVFSFYPTKNMTTGEGGIITSNDSAFIENCKVLLNHGMRGRYNYTTLGFNYRMNDLSAAIGLAQLGKVKNMNVSREHNATYYIEKINNVVVQLPHIQENSQHVFHQFTLMSEKRGELIEHLMENDIQCGIYYPQPLNEISHVKTELYKNKIFEDTKTNVKEVCQRVCSIPVHPLLKNSEKEKVVKVINQFK